MNTAKKKGFLKFIAHIWESISSLWRNVVPEVQEWANLAVNITNQIKDGTTFAVILSALPEDLQEKVKDVIQKSIPTLYNLNDYIQQANPEDILQTINTYLGKLEGVHRNAFLENLSSLFMDAFADGKLSWEDISLIPKFVYKQWLNK